MDTQIMVADAIFNRGEHIAMATIGGLAVLVGILLLILYRMEGGRVA